MIIANAYDHRSDALSSVCALIAIAAAKFAYAIIDSARSRNIDNKCEWS